MGSVVEYHHAKVTNEARVYKVAKMIRNYRYVVVDQHQRGSQRQPKPDHLLLPHPHQGRAALENGSGPHRTREP